MKMRVIFLALVVAMGSLVSPSGAAHADTGDKVGLYVGHSPVWWEEVRTCTAERQSLQSLSAVGVGGWCFADLPAGTYRVNVEDLSGLPLYVTMATDTFFADFCGVETVIDFPGGSLAVGAIGVLGTEICSTWKGVTVFPATGGSITLSSA